MWYTFGSLITASIISLWLICFVFFYRRGLLAYEPWNIIASPFVIVDLNMNINGNNVVSDSEEIIFRCIAISLCFLVPQKMRYYNMYGKNRSHGYDLFWARVAENFFWFIITIRYPGWLCCVN